MNKRTTVALLAAAVVFSTTVIGASAFSSATLSRDAGVDVVTDANGIIGLADNSTGSIVSENASGVLTIDFATGSATGVNPEATYVIGDNGTVTTNHAFQLINNDGTSHTINMEYLPNSDSDSITGIEFHVFDSGGTHVTTVSDENGQQSWNQAGTTTYYVVVEVSTASLGSSDDLSGTLKITV